MKCVIPEISYHNRDPVLSLDFQLSSKDSVTRLATAGSDNHVVIWSVHQSDQGDVSLECLSDLTRHQKAVNIVRWSPDGTLLASGDDESVIIVWHLKPGDSSYGGLFDDEQNNKENWVVYKMIRSHLDDVYDLSWSGCGQFLVSGSVDNAAIITNVHKNNKVGHFSDSRGYIQGVSWNKKHNLVSTLSSDRSCRTYNSSTKKLISKNYKAHLNLNDESSKKKINKDKSGAADKDSKNSGKEILGNEGTIKDNKATETKVKEKEVRLYHDETFKGFFRRLTWSTDGELLVAPSGVLETEDSSKLSHCSWVYTRTDVSKPALCLPTKDKYTTAVRFSPKLYKLRPVKGAPKDTDPEKPWLAAKSLFALPYRLVYAVATQNAIMFYDSQQLAPFGRVSNVHYTGLTDLSWSPCGNILLASSSDGYCSIVSFTAGEIGEVYDDNKTTVSNTDSNSTKPTQGTSINQKSFSSEDSKSVKETKSNAKRLDFVTISSPKANKKMNRIAPVDSKDSDKMEMNLDCDPSDLGVEKMDTDDNDLNLVLEETQPEPPTAPVAAPAQVQVRPVSVNDGKKRVPLTTIHSGANSTKTHAATPEKSKGRRVNLITLSSPKPKN